MAGDWIKVEVSTSHKAEVLRMAEMLGITRRECMGLLVDFWAWLDANSRTELVPNLSRKSLDGVLECAGFASCLESVGWAKWSADGWTMTVNNYAVHNGTSAKTRAYEQRKKKIQREKLSRLCPDDLGTREEKRREEELQHHCAIPAKTTSPKTHAAPPGFAAFWQAYPATRRRVAKQACLAKWQRNGCETSAEAIVAHVRAMSATEQWREGYEPAPLTYLNQRRWEDGVPSIAPSRRVAL